MDEATSKQKEFIRKLLLGNEFHWRNINPLEFWEISRGDASHLINDLKTLQRHYSRDLRDMICQNIDGKRIIYNMARTIEELEEEQELATYDPTTVDWLDQQTYEDDIRQNEWIHEMRAEIRKQEVF
jgi:hypothetical protein